VLAQELERIFGQVGVWVGRDDGLVEDPPRAVRPLDAEAPRVDVVEAASDELSGLAYQLLALLIGNKLAHQVQYAAV